MAPASPDRDRTIPPSWSRETVLRRSLQLVLATSFLLLPAHELIYHVAFKGRGIVGWELLFPEQLLLLAVLWWFRGSAASAMSAWRFEIGLMAVNAAAFWASVVANGSNSRYALQVFVVGSVLPVVFLLLLSVATESYKFDPVRDGLPALLISVGLVCAVGLVAYPASFGIPRDFHEFIYDIRTDRAVLGIREGYWYGDVTLGNFNVFASCLLPSLLLGYGWFRSRQGGPRARMILGAVWCTAVLANLYLCYSRGSFLVLNVCVALMGVLWFHRRETRGHLLRVGVALLAFDMLVVAPPGAIAYWRSLGEKAPSNSAVQRIGQWEELAEGVPGRTAVVGEATKRESAKPAASRGRLSYLLFGVGVGNYGTARGLGLDANTHNLFLNQFVTGGLPGFVSFALLFGLVLVRGFRNPLRQTDGRNLLQLSAFVGLVAIGLMGILSQYEFANLGAITGGLLFWTCAFFSRLDPTGAAS